MMSDDKTPVPLSPQEISLLWQILDQVQIPGRVAEVFVELKASVRSAMESLSPRDRVE